jgi:hypothetical protein
MHRLCCVAPIAALSLLGACDGAAGEFGDEPSSRREASLARVIAAAERTVEAGASALSAEVGNRVVGYVLRGRIDLRAGYRACARVEQIRGARGQGFLANRVLWLAGGAGAISYGKRRGSWDHVLKGLPPGAPAPQCPKGGGWLNDHPPTLGLSRPSDTEAATTGAESYLHLAMMAITRLREGALRVRPLNRSRAIEVEIDFGRYDERPPDRDEDAWEVRPLLRSAGTLPVTVRFDHADRLIGIDLEAPGDVGRGSAGPVRVSLALSRLGRERPVSEVVVSAHE